MSNSAFLRADTWRRLAVSTTAVLALTALSGCGGSDNESADKPSAVQTASDGSTFNQADVDFASQMLPHHAQAVQMVVMAQGRELDAPVAALMEDIRGAQVPEIETMSDWLTTWGEPIPETSLDHANAEKELADMDDMGAMPGMMTAEQMVSLEDASGSAFQTLWLQMMISHHDGAIEMARTEIENGSNAEAVALAEDIVESQTAEIESMGDMLS